MLPKVKINYVDFWPTFRREDYFFTKLLRQRFDVEFSEDPEVVFYSAFGGQFRRYRCKRIFYTGENVRPNFSCCDFAVSFDYSDDPRCYRFPWWAQWLDPKSLIQKSQRDTDLLLSSNRKFCSFVVSNGDCRVRNEFFQRLSKYKQVDSGGGYLNNVGGRVADKMGFLRKYKFNIAFENSSYPGYTTEKLPEAMLTNTVPIYWGDPLVGREFDTKSFIRVESRSNFDYAIDRIIEADKDDNVYAEYLRQHWLVDNKLPEHCDFDRLLDFFEAAVKQKVSLSANSRMKRTAANASYWMNRARDFRRRAFRKMKSKIKLA